MDERVPTTATGEVDSRTSHGRQENHTMWLAREPHNVVGGEQAQAPPLPPPPTPNPTPPPPHVPNSVGIGPVKWLLIALK